MCQACCPLAEPWPSQDTAPTVNPSLNPCRAGSYASKGSSVAIDKCSASGNQWSLSAVDGKPACSLRLHAVAQADQLLQRGPPQP